VNADEQRRLSSIKAQSGNLFGKNFPMGYQTPTIQRNVKNFSQGDDLHHRAILSVYEPFFSGLNQTDTVAMIDTLASYGVFTGNNPLNFTAMKNKEDHQGGIHRYAADYGIQLKGDDLRIKGLEEAIDPETGKKTGQLMPSSGMFLDKIRNSSFDERVAALPDFIKYGQDELDRHLRDDLGYDVPSRKEQVALYNQLVEKEHQAVIAESIKRSINSKLDSQRLPKTGDKRALAAIDILRAL
jgi:hypothetical protein